MSYGRRLGPGFLGAALGWAVMVTVAALINTALIGILIFWPIYGVTFLLSGLVGTFVAAAFPLSSRRTTLFLAAAITILLFSLMPAWFFWINQGSTRF